ncbi:hypothetical protein [Streptomyces niveus]|uniref:hypothetical protein n=1 Tax=Streptomyces niveus TaxID=193462 RepID=UPI0036499B15
MEKIICKCGATTYEAHMNNDAPAHTYKPDKASGQVRQAITDPDDDFDVSDRVAFGRLARRALFGRP